MAGGVDPADAVDFLHGDGDAAEAGESVREFAEDAFPDVFVFGMDDLDDEADDLEVCEL